MPQNLTVPINDPSLVREQCYIDGRWVDADSGERMDVINKASGQSLGSVPKMVADETRRAIDAANAALPSSA